jgi:nickel-dependent lactate racemase
MVEIGLAYGDEILKASIPSENLKIVERRSYPPLRNWKEDAGIALDSPIGVESLEKSVSKGDRIAIIVDDLTRDTPVSLLLQMLLRRLEDASVDTDHVDIVMATGTHEEPPTEKVKEKIGHKVAERYKVTIHNSLEKENLAYLGLTSRGTPVWINRAVAEADLKIGIGGIRPHAEAGFGGGGKVILPGVSAWESIGNNHFLYAHPKSRFGILEGNPFRMDIEENATVAGLDFILNVVLNKEGQMAKVVAGDPIAAHREGVKVVRAICENPIKRKADILIMSFGPKDQTLWQLIGSANTLSMADQAVKRGGSVILVGSCREGIYRRFLGIHHLNYKGDQTGVEDFLQLLSSGAEPHEICSETLRGNIPYMELGAKGIVLSSLIRERNITIVSRELNPEDVKWLGTLSSNVDEAANAALKEQGKDSDIIVANASAFKTSPRMVPYVSAACEHSLV